MKADLAPDEERRNLTAALVLCLSLLGYPTKRSRIREVGKNLACVCEFKGNLVAVVDDAATCCRVMTDAKQKKGERR